MKKANLVFIIQDSKILLIEKKRGVGQDLYNGPGGKVEENETVKESAKRELKEETNLTAESLDKKGLLNFYFGEKPFMEVHVFLCKKFNGTPKETKEARPEWFEIDEIPYERMWPDDKYWLPLLVEGKEFEGTFNFDEEGNKIENYQLTQK